VCVSERERERQMYRFRLVSNLCWKGRMGVGVIWLNGGFEDRKALV
jgi:hypothetical protein